MPDTLPEDLPHGLRLSGADQTRFALIERGAAWSLAAAVLGAARIGSGSVLLVEGASGVGKTPLVRAIMSLALESGMQVLSASGRKRERKLRYGVIMQLAESGLRREAPVSPAPFASGGAPVLGQRAAAIPALDDLRGLYRMCLNVAGAAPLVLLVDDADLADESSLEALLYLAERIADEPVALVLT
ncbi:MAG: ATP-binding protein, partial [Propionibacteriaceae bacterium]